MAKLTKCDSENKSTKSSEFHSLLNGTSKPILEQWKTEASEAPHPPWAPKPTHQQRYADNDVLYMAKIKALVEMSDYIYDRNLKLKYRLNAVAKEIKCLKRVKRVLCRRLFEHNSKELVDTYLEIPDSDTSTMVMDQIIGDVVNTATQAKVTPLPVVKKKKKDPKASQQNAKPPPTPTNYSKEEEINQHILSVIDNVANTNYKTSNGPTPSKKPRKQNLAALTSPTKDTLNFLNGNNTAQSSTNNVYGNNNNAFTTPQIKVPSKLDLSPNAPSSTQSTAFTPPINLPIYVKRELVYPPERRDLKTTLPMPNSTSISSVYSVPSTVSQSKLLSPSTPTSNGQQNNTSDPTHFYIPKQLISPTYNSVAASPSPSNSIDLSIRQTDSGSIPKTYYSRLSDSHSPVYNNSALTRDNLKTQNEDLRTQPTICGGAVPTSSNRDF